MGSIATRRMWCGNFGRARDYEEAVFLTERNPREQKQKGRQVLAAFICLLRFGLRAG
jgi:hypothetical protein